MKFPAKTEKEIAEMNNLPPGDYPFEVLNAVDGKSSKGNDMITLTLRVFVGDSSRQLNDYLLEAMPGKLFHFCQYTGLADKYAAGTLSADDCLGRTGYLTTGIQKGKEKDDGSGDVWPDRATVKDYIRGEFKKKEPVISSPATASPEKDDSIPF